MVFVWDRSTRTGKLYLNGAHAGEKQSAYTGQDIDLNLTNHTTYELGLKKDSMKKTRGSLRDLMVFLRPLTTWEAFTLYSKFCILHCGYRRIDIQILLAVVNGGASKRSLLLVRLMEGVASFPSFTRMHNACTDMELENLWCGAKSIETPAPLN